MVVGAPFLGIGAGFDKKPFLVSGAIVTGAGLVTVIAGTVMAVLFNRNARKLATNIDYSTSYGVNTVTHTTTYHFDMEKKYKEKYEKELERRDNLYPDPFDTSKMDIEE